MAGNDSFTLSVAGRARSKVSPFYNPTLDNLSKEARDLFENYSGIEPDRVVSNVEEIRDRAWAIVPPPTIPLQTSHLLPVPPVSLPMHWPIPLRQPQPTHLTPLPQHPLAPQRRQANLPRPRLLSRDRDQTARR
ncbi:hypothetical protein V502_02244 [Pseudogymnoascus sp. VKM F-4520 (FW-2644)]|nr:hypothetical protein V502_02244 [Pseudogymnoascus sp. VKM F-4520 (FW-2644)]